jgi:type II secretory pathway pseudopilin PulG
MQTRTGRLTTGPRGGTAGRGFTLVEAVLAAMLLALVSVALGSQLSAARAQSAAGSRTLAASMLARALLQEVLRLPYSAPVGTPPNAVRSTFTTAGEYNGYTDGPTNITNLAGVAYPANMQGFVRTVSETPQTYTLALPGNAQPYSVTGMNVQVTVQWQGATVFTLQQFITELPQQP